MRDREKQREYMKEYWKKWYLENKEKIITRSKEYAENNKEHVKEYKKTWEKEYKDRDYVQVNAKLASKKYYAKNREEILKKKKEYWDLNKNIIKRNEKVRRLKRDYKITPKDYNELLIKQNYKCAICNIPESESFNGLHIDHCHKTKKVRGLLCMQCNTVLGKVNDNIKILENAITYLKSHNEDF